MTSSTGSSHSCRQQRLLPRRSFKGEWQSFTVRVWLMSPRRVCRLRHRGTGPWRRLEFVRSVKGRASAGRSFVPDSAPCPPPLGAVLRWRPRMRETSVSTSALASPCAPPPRLIVVLWSIRWCTAEQVAHEPWPLMMWSSSASTSDEVPGQRCPPLRIGLFWMRWFAPPTALPREDHVNHRGEA